MYAVTGNGAEIVRYPTKDEAERVASTLRRNGDPRIGYDVRPTEGAER